VLITLVTNPDRSYYNGDLTSGQARPILSEAIRRFNLRGTKKILRGRASSLSAPPYPLRLRICLRDHTDATLGAERQKDLDRARSQKSSHVDIPDNLSVGVD
jgi:hypothetical protein